MLQENSIEEICPFQVLDGIDRQTEIEKDASKRSVREYRNRNEKLISRGKAADTPWGRVAVLRSIKRFVDRLDKIRQDAKSKAGRHHSVVPLLECLSSSTVAAIAARSIINDAYLRVGIPVVAICANLGSLVQAEVQAVEFKDAAGTPLFNTFIDVLERSEGGARPEVRKKAIANVANKYAVAVSRWETTDRVNVGRFLLEHFRDSTGYIEIVRGGRYGKEERIRPTESLEIMVKDFNSRNEILLPILEPMVIKPRPWNGFTGGGYLSLRGRVSKLIPSATKEHQQKLEMSDQSEVFAALAHLQETRWRVNRWVFDQAIHARKIGIPIGATLAGDDLPIPAKLGPDASEEEWKLRNASAREVYQTNLARENKRLREDALFRVAQAFVDKPTLYLPYQLDFRGRVYAVPSHLNPQGHDMAKGFLEFADGKSLGSEGWKWLLIHAANCYGKDKISYTDRIAWAEDNLHLMIRVAAEPFGDLKGFWIDADGGDSPWRFLAACKAVADAVEQGADFQCHLPVTVDGTNNGLQHFSAMLRDRQCGSLVNLEPAHQPADIYRTVAEAVQAELVERNDEEMSRLWQQFGVDRSICKGPVMVIPFGGKEDGVRDKIIESIIANVSKKHIFDGIVGEAATYLKDIMWAKMEGLMPGPHKAMRWLQDAAVSVAELNRPVAWKSPSGFIAQQDYYKPQFSRIKVYVLGKEIRMKVHKGDTPRIDTKKQEQSISANFVHSLDAAALVLTVNKARERGVSHFACVHDSYGTHASDIPVLQNCIRDVFVEMYSRDILADFKSQLDPVLSVPLDPPPEMGDLDLACVKKSDYFFA
ncbi:MAG: hypothetical protein QM754_18175 [Tepidisphaeraceae bacterium]